MLSAEKNKIIIEKVEQRKNIMELFENFDGEYTPVDVDWGQPEGEEILVKQGDIIKVSLNFQKGHEQAGYRLEVVVSNNFFNQKTNFNIVCPITNTNNKFPLHIPLNSRTQASGICPPPKKHLERVKKPVKKEPSMIE